MNRYFFSFIILIAGCTTPPPSISPSELNTIPSPPKGKVGLDVLLEERQDLIIGKTIGLVTNHTGVDKNGTPNYDRILEMNDVDLKIIFSPEHGLFGESAAGEKVYYNGQIKTLPTVVSLYGKNRKPTPEQMRGLDLILYDIQDVGARFYTYISTMGLVMEAAAESGVEVIILDRPNPITGTKVEGPILDLTHQSFVGKYPIPIRYGLTAGELAQMIIGEKWINNIPRIDVVLADGWNRTQWQDETHLPWVKPSPNIPDIDTAIIYPGMCLLEATNVNEGRGTQKPFKRFGAPWILKENLAESLNNNHLPGVRFTAVTFIPTDLEGMANNPKYENQVCHGIEIQITDRNTYNSVATGITVIETLQKLYPNKFEIKTSGMNRLWGINDHDFSNYNEGKESQYFKKKAEGYYLYE